MIRWRFIFRQINSSRKQALIFILCVSLSLLTLVSLGGFSNSVRQSMLKDARQLHAADIMIHTHYPASNTLLEIVNRYKSEGLAEAVLVHEFYSMARNTGREKSLLSELKVVEKGYPFYGTVVLKSGLDFSKILQAGRIIVEQNVLDRLQADIGDRLQIGSTELTIVDVVVSEPDRPVSFFSFGPRIFIAADDLEKIDLIKKGSRIHYNYLLKIHNQDMVDTLADELSDVAIEVQERVNTFRTAESGVKRFFENFLFFLNLIGIFTLLLAGIGIQAALYTLLRESNYTIAIMKSLGAGSAYIFLHFTVMIMLLGTVGTVLGLFFSYLLQLYFPVLFTGILPAHVTLTIAWDVVFEGLVLGTVVVGLFSYLPMRRLRNVKPALIFRKEVEATRNDLPHYASITLTILFFIGLAVWQLEDVKTGIYFVLGLLGLVAFTAIVTQVLLMLMKKRSPRLLTLRQAFRGLFRPKNATRSIIITLSASLAVIFSIYIIEQNLQSTFIQSYPPELPNAYFLDIQPSQKQEFSNILGEEPQYYPIIRARLTSINDRRINRKEERQRRRDNLAREFNLTYRDFLLDDERITEGNNLFGDLDQNSLGNGELPVSVLDFVAEIGDIKIGDLLVFNVQGIPLQARVVSMRTRTASRVRPFFYFVFPEKTLKDAPQTIFSAVKIDRQRLTMMQNRLAEQLPNVSVIDIGKTIEVLARIIQKLSSIIQFFTLFSIIAGLLIIISSVFATKLARIREAVYFKILGAGQGFVLQVFTYENLIVALICALQAGIISHVGSWAVCRWIFDVPYKPLPVATGIMILSTILLVITVGLSASLSILRQKPIGYLRDEGQE